MRHVGAIVRTDQVDQVLSTGLMLQNVSGMLTSHTRTTFTPVTYHISKPSSYIGFHKICMQAERNATPNFDSISIQIF